MNNDLISAFTLGLIGGAIPGPVLTAIFTEVLQSGLFKSLRIILLAMFAEASVASISLFIFSSLHFPETMFRGISLIGAGILIWIAHSLWKITKIDTKTRVHFSVGKIAAMIVANGLLWTFWITICIPKAILLKQKMPFGDIAFLVLVEVGWLVATVFIAFLFSRFRTLLSKPRFVPIIFKIFALAFIYFALDMLYKSIAFFAGVKF